MSEFRNHKFYAMEVAPPEGTWEKIASRLDQEFSAADVRNSRRLAEFEETPPPGTWESINRQIHAEEEGKISSSIKLPSYFRRLAVAAILAGIVLTAGIYFITGNNKPGNALAVTEKNSTKESIKSPDSGLSGPESGNATAGIQGKNNENITRDNPITRPPAKVPVSLLPQHLHEAKIPENDLLYASASAVKDQGKVHKPQVNAPLIRDEEGNVVMDLALLTSKGNEYFTVTGPNGEQTRLSTKFLPVISYLNNGHSGYDNYFDLVFLDHADWKRKFEEWRNTIMQRASFAPTSGNLLDIVELKDMIQDNK